MTSESTVKPSAATVEAACEVMHDAYERAAVGAGWDTNPASRKPWSEVPDANQQTMRAAVTALLIWLDECRTAEVGQPDSDVASRCMTCNGWNPVSGVKRRETVGLVCPTCGWDYSKGSRRERRRHCPHQPLT